MELKFDEATIEGIYKQIQKKKQLIKDLNKLAARRYVVMSWEEGSPGYAMRIEVDEDMVRHICLGYAQQVKNINQWLKNNGVVINEK